MRTSGMELDLRLLEGFPVQPQVPNDMSQRADFEVFATPIRHRGDPSRGGIVPLAMGATASSGQFFAPQCAQFVGDFAVPHGVTAVSIQKGVCTSSATRSNTGGKGRPRSS
jgi:hypothetical protein